MAENAPNANPPQNPGGQPPAARPINVTNVVLFRMGVRLSNGKLPDVPQLAKELGVPEAALQQRLDDGFTSSVRIFLDSDPTILDRMIKVPITKWT